MRNKLTATIAIAASSVALAAAPIAAQARHHQQRVLVCKNVRHAANKGMVIGAVGGGLLGHTIAGHGDKTGGTLIGAGVGAVAGHQIAKHNAQKKCHYEYR
ncbi:glycine zipper 2TM domain-containing protein [Phenylobacterium sp.]|uniref:glycine zipper 2TM domain-containing protein n=1 Tax=Phenylobacterium sp. TaxID=1871053 RepID=UPI0025DE08FD|nr:glycine zipper 2TM domain-containing protein [Phenylobacterium sp.]